jgi:hypothetical protein
MMISLATFLNHHRSQQTFLTNRQLDTRSSASAAPPVGRLVQQSEPQPSSDQGRGTCCPGQGYSPHHLVSAMTEPAYRAASELSLTAMGQLNSFPPATGFLSQHCVCALKEPDICTLRTISFAYQNHVLLIHQLHLPVRGGTFTHKQQPGIVQGSGSFPSWWSGPANSVTRSLYDLSSLTHQNYAKSSHDSDCGSESKNEELD